MILYINKSYNQVKYVQEYSRTGMIAVHLACGLMNDVSVV